MRGSFDGNLRPLFGREVIGGQFQADQARQSFAHGNLPGSKWGKISFQTALRQVFGGFFHGDIQPVECLSGFQEVFFLLFHMITLDKFLHKHAGQFLFFRLFPPLHQIGQNSSRIG